MRAKRASKKIGIFKAKLRKTNGKSSKKSDFELFQILANNKTPGQHLENFWSLIRPPEKHLADLSLKGFWQFQTLGIHRKNDIQRSAH